MFKVAQKQNGSALVVVIIILVVAVVGALGFVVWNNYFVPKKSEATESTASNQGETKNTPAVATQTYDTGSYSFQYPKDGWVLIEEQFGTDPTKVPYVKTANWAQAGPGLAAGGEVSVSVTTATQTLAQMKDNAANNNGGGKDLVDTQVGGVAAFSYDSGYEGWHYFTIFINKGLVYQITYRYGENDQPETYIDGYKEIVSSFTFK